jgi:hypothetical protein
MATQTFSMALIGHAFYREKNLGVYVYKDNKSDLSTCIYSCFDFLSTPKRNFYSIYATTVALFSSFLLLKNLTTKKLTLEDYVNSYEFRGIKIGDLIYDSYIRYKQRFKYPNKLLIALQHLTFIKKMVEIEKTILHLKPKRVIASTYVYASVSSAATRVALSKKIPVIILKGSLVKKLDSFNDALQAPRYIKKEDFSRAYNCENPTRFQAEWRKRIRGENKNMGQNDAINAYTNGEVLHEPSEVLSLCGIKNIKKFPIYVIMPHAFSDANHAKGDFVFLDYYSWFKKTLEIVSAVDSAYWLIKPHPSSSYYGEIGLVESLASQFIKHNIALIPDSLSTESILNVSDAVITARGTIALEAACFGIKAIQAGNAEWSDIDITFEAKSVRQYVEMLENIQDLPPLGRDVVKRARNFFLHYTVDTYLDSEFFNHGIKMNPGMGPSEARAKEGAIIDHWVETIKKKPFDEDSYFESLCKLLKEGNI